MALYLEPADAFLLRRISDFSSMDVDAVAPIW